MKTRYFLSHPVLGEKEVTEKEYIQAERDAGFYPKFGKGPATGGFSNSQGNVSGRIEYLTEVDLDGDDYGN